MLALKPGIHGIMNLTGPGEAPLSVLLRELVAPTLPLPASLLTLVVRGLWRLGLSSFPTPELAHIRYVCMVDGGRARREMGFRPQYSLRETVRAVLAEE